jgi:gliding motility-associated-like protein
MVTLVAKNSFGCTDTARVAIKMTEDVVFYVPNAFTPDGDQFNNVFKPVIATGFDGYDYELLIFDRWGELIFESHDINIGWDGVYKLTGKICQDGAYVWKINIKKKGVDDRITKTGHVTLIR